MVMYLNCLKHLPDEGITVRELERRARTGTNLNGMLRWGYLWMAPSPMDTRTKPPMADWLIGPTTAGSAAKQVWEPLFEAIERRWEKRFGWDQIEELRSTLRAVVMELPASLPNCMPILGFGLSMKGKPGKKGDSAVADAEPVEELKLVELLARALVAFALEFEDAAKLSLALCADVLRVINEKGVRVRDLPSLSGVSKEAIAMALGFMEKRGLCIEEQESAGKPRVIRLTAKGRAAQIGYVLAEKEIEARWAKLFGEKLPCLRRALEKLLGDSGRDQAELLMSAEPQKGCWRAEVPGPKILPWFPMVLHRGGYPDGS
jgi:DNA-binding MarR family transcriptional regulator